MELGVDCGKGLGHPIDVLFWLLHNCSTTGGLCALVIIVFILFSLGAVGIWMSLLTKILAFLVLPILLVVVFITIDSLVIYDYYTFTLLASPCANYDTLDACILGTDILIYLSRICRVCGQDLGYRLFPVVK